MSGNCIIIISPHRSGSSALSGILKHSGVAFGSNLLPSSFDNSKGFYEIPEVVYLNDKILSYYGYTWWDYKELPTFWWKNDLPEIFIEEALSIINSNFDSSSDYIGLKDPRFSITFPFWHDILKTRLGYLIHPILIIRNPAQIIGSLRKRNNFTAEFAGYLSLRYLLDSLNCLKELNPVIVSLDSLVLNYEIEYNSLIRNLGLSESVANNFFDKNLLNTEGLEDVTDSKYLILLNSIHKYILANRDEKGRVDLNIVLDKIDESNIEVGKPNKYKREGELLKLGKSFLSVFFTNPIKFLHVMNFSNYEKLLIAIKEESPKTIIKNLRKLISESDDASKISNP